jgi:phosphatidylinositol kinase/protein kinase (PI-3  family)
MLSKNLHRAGKNRIANSILRLIMEFIMPFLSFFSSNICLRGQGSGKIQKNQISKINNLFSVASAKEDRHLVLP